MNQKTIIAMSGGVDSSVAACLMKERGYDCIGITMKLFQNDDIIMTRECSCCSLDDVEDARHVAYQLQIPYYVCNFSDEFEENVIKRFVNAYENGCTPNPCIDCNRYLKFEKLYKRAWELGCDTIATGHYARITYDRVSGRYILKKAIDGSKDQSYVLYSMTQEQLAHTQFPLGDLTKVQVRAIAEMQKFSNAYKHDSQDICFVQNGTYSDFIEKYTGITYPCGDFIDVYGNILGRHNGIIRYTIGQRRGLGLNHSEPLYVCAIDPENNTVTLGRVKDLYTCELTVTNINLISVPFIETPQRLKVKIRYRHVEQWATVTQINENTLKIMFDKPQRAITKGQAAVLYDDDIVVGGGIII